MTSAGGADSRGADAGGTAPAGLPSESLTAAEAELARVREVLESAARGDANAAEVTEAVKGYMEEHGPALKAAAAAVGEEARRQTLEQLYEWRARLAAQTEDQKRQP